MNNCVRNVLRVMSVNNVSIPCEPVPIVSRHGHNYETLSANMTCVGQYFQHKCGPGIQFVAQVSNSVFNTFELSLVIGFVHSFIMRKLLHTKSQIVVSTFAMWSDNPAEPSSKRLLHRSYFTFPENRTG